MRQLSMSGLAILEHCRAPFSLDAPDWPESEPGDAAERGTAVHGWAERYIRNFLGMQPIDKETEGKIAAWEADVTFKAITNAMVPWLEKNIKPEWIPELAIAWNVEEDSARILAAEYHRDYRSADPATEICGTADLAWIRIDEQGSVAVVRDFKTGHQTAEHYAAQMRGLALAFARAWGCDRAESQLIYLGEDGVFEAPIVAYDAMELASNAEALKTQLAEAKSGTTKRHAGDWCSKHYCPLRATCPETQTAMALASPDESPLFPYVADMALIQGPQHAAWLVQRLAAVKSAVQAGNDAVKAYIKANGPVPIGGGKELRLVTKDREVFAKKTAIGMLRSSGIDAGLVDGLFTRSRAWQEIEEGKIK